MSNETAILSKAVLQAGLVNATQLAELQRWNSPNVEDAAPVAALASLEETTLLITNALQSEGFVLMRETNLEVLHRYLSTQQMGLLHLQVGDQETEFPVSFGRGLLGEYIIPWRSEAIEDAMLSMGTFLFVDNQKVYFKDVRELFFGEQRSFMVCEAAL